MLGRVGGDFGRMGLVRPAGHLAGASLDLNFVASSGYPAAPSLLLTTTRASDAYADDTAGNWTLFASGVPRITNKGLLVEEARTNSIRNNSMQGAVAGTPGTPPTNWAAAATGLTIQLVGTGTENGVDYVDYRLSGTTGATSGTISFETSTGVDAATAQVWTESAFLSFVGGATTNITSMFFTITENDSGGAFIANNDGSDFIASLTSALTRFSATRTLAGGVSVAKAQPRLRLTWSAAAAIDITLRIGWPQLELGAFATSPIRTTGVSATRAADVATASAVLAGPRTMYAEGAPSAPDSYATSQILAQLDNGTANERILFFRASANPSGTVVVGGSSVDYNAIDLGTHSQNATGKYALALESGAQSGVFNAGSISAGVKASLPTTSSTLRLGCNSAGAGQWNGYIRRISLFPSRLADAQLQVLTA